MDCIHFSLIFVCTSGSKDEKFGSSMALEILFAFSLEVFALRNLFLHSCSSDSSESPEAGSLLVAANVRSSLGGARTARNTFFRFKTFLDRDE